MQCWKEDGRLWMNRGREKFDCSRLRRKGEHGGVSTAQRYSELNTQVYIY